jgi:hypothetical protein
MTIPTTSIHNRPLIQSMENLWQNNLVQFAVVAITISAIGMCLAELASFISEVIQDKIWKPDIKALEEKLKTRFSENFLNQVKKLGLDYVILFKRLAISTEDEKQILNNLESQFKISEDQWKEIFSGAHIRLSDDGKVYDQWTKLIKTRHERLSSHPSDISQYGVQGPFIKELLFSRVTDAQGKTYTWFQLENHPVSFGHIVRHMLDYFKYKFTQKNQGPYGNSVATDQKPILLVQKEKPGFSAEMSSTN